LLHNIDVYVVTRKITRKEERKGKGEGERKEREGKRNSLIKINLYEREKLKCLSGLYRGR